MRTLGMIFFLLVVALVYGGVNTYIYFKAHAAFHFGALSGGAVIAFMALMFLMFFIGHGLDRVGVHTVARAAHIAAGVWLGLVFLFFSSSLLVDLYRLAVYLGGLAAGRSLAAAMPSPSLAFFLPAAATIALNVAGYVEGKTLRVETLTIRTSKLPEGVDRLRIVQISDIHIGPVIQGRRAVDIFERVRALSPDILVSTGDLVDQSVCDVAGLVGPLLAIEAPEGKFAVTGNHEFYAGLEQALHFTRQAGFVVLRGEVAAAGGITLAGVDDSEAERFEREAPATERQVLSKVEGDGYRILLKHRPTIARDALGLFDLQLSGHTHKGQIFPFSLLTRLVYVVDAGWLDLDGGSHLYVSRGTGLWGPPIRLLAPPEITVIDLVRAGR
jgi:predicted MPP superfamily phosphohydrolase